MNSKQILESNIDATLNSLDGLQRAEPTPFFYTRLKARMDKAYSSKGIAGISWLKPSLAFSILTLLVVLNLVTIINKKTTTEQATTNGNVSQQVAKEYDLGITTY